MSDVDANGSWGNAVRTFEDLRPDLSAPAAGILTDYGSCQSCGAETHLYRTSTSTEPDTCTSCRGKVTLARN